MRQQSEMEATHSSIDLAGGQILKDDFFAIDNSHYLPPNYTPNCGNIAENRRESMPSSHWLYTGGGSVCNKTT